MHDPIPRSVLVVGPGTMGRGIARLLAGAGLAVTVLARPDTPTDFRHPGVQVVTEPPADVPDLVIESVFEIADVKRAVYARIEAAYGGRPVLATNTSGLPLEDLARDLRFPGRFLGLHFFMPADRSTMVEVVRTGDTDDGAVAVALAALARAGREPIVLDRPVVGFLMNRLQHAVLHEAYALIEQGVATPDMVDRVAKRLLGPRMCVTGLVEQKDLAGLTMHSQAHAAIVPTLAHTKRPSPLLLELAARGETGLKAGRGFYDWRGRDAQAVLDAASARLARVLAFLYDDLGDGDPALRPAPSRWWRRA
jgi:3-hydroxybutyryl-CoA dehydrogenase